MKQYHSYSRCSLNWIHSIPSHWSLIPFGRLFSLKKEISGTTGLDVLSVTQNGIRVKDISNNEGQIAQDYSKYQLVAPGDYIMNHMDLLTGYIGISEYSGVTSPDYRVFYSNSDSVNDEFFLYIFQLCYKRKIFYGLGQGVANKGRWRLPADQLRRFLLPLPPVNEQKKIVDYLKTRVGEISQLISNKEHEILKLSQAKQNIIYQAVTCGLKPNRSKQECDLLWVKSIPADWSVKRLKVSLSERKESYDPSEELIILSLLKDRGVIPYSEKGNVGNKSKDDLSQYKVARKGDLVLNSMNIIIGSVGVSDYDGYISPAYYTFFPKSGVNIRFFEYMFKLVPVQKSIRTKAKGIMEIRLRISSNDLLSMNFPLPPLTEQNEIVEYLNTRCQLIDNYISGVETEITKLKEYSTRMISDVVTGQINVQDEII